MDSEQSRPVMDSTQVYEVGDRVRIDIPDETDPDFTYHRQHGTVAAVMEDSAAEVTGDERDGIIYRVRLESGEEIDVRWRDVRPPSR